METPTFQKKKLSNIEKKFLHSHEVVFQTCQCRSISQKCNGNSFFTNIHHRTWHWWIPRSRSSPRNPLSVVAATHKDFAFAIPLTLFVFGCRLLQQQQQQPRWLFQLARDLSMLLLLTKWSLCGTRFYENYSSYAKHLLMETPASRSCTLSKLQKYCIYFAQNCNGNTTNETHSARLWLHRKRVQVLDWPSCSEDHWT